MIEFSQMLWRLVIALGLGALMGVERELAGKEAGVRTSMLVSGGSSLFVLAALSLPYLLAISPQHLPSVLASNSGFLALIANIVVGIGFIGGGIIIKTEEHVHGLTTAAAIWTNAAIGILVGIGLVRFAAASAILISLLLFSLRKFDLSALIKKLQTPGD